MNYIATFSLLLCFHLFAVQAKECRIRDYKLLYAEPYFKYEAGYVCYTASNKRWLNGGQFIKTYNYVNDDGYSMHYFLAYGTKYLFDYEDKNALVYIRQLFTSDFYFEKWNTCAKAAIECCHEMNPDDMMPSENYPCPALWDGWQCFGKAKANTTSYRKCPIYTTSSDSLVCNLEAEKYCLSTDWNHVTNYATCASAPIYRKRHEFHVTILYVAIGLIFPSIVILFSFEKLRQFAFALHRNLIIAILVKNILVVISKNVVLLDALNLPSNNVMEEDGKACRALAYFENLSKNLIFICMTIDAFYLHKAIVRPFSRDNLNIYILYAIALLISTIPTTIWSILMGTNNANNCWMVDTAWYQWITDSFKYTMLAINVILLIDIMRVLITMLCKKESNRKKTGQAVRASLLMAILFGVPLLVSSQRNMVDMDNCVAGDIYYYFTYSMEAAQGILLALFFCYFKKEVHQEFKNAYTKAKRYMTNRFGWFNKNQPSGPRRTTATTKVSHA